MINDYPALSTIIVSGLNRYPSKDERISNGETSGSRRAPADHRSPHASATLPEIRYGRGHVRLIVGTVAGVLLFFGALIMSANASLNKRINYLEAEVRRLTALQPKPPSSPWDLPSNASQPPPPPSYTPRPSESSLIPAPSNRSFISGNCDDDHWIEEVTDSGSLITLEDGSIWEVDSVDTITSSLWLTTSDIIICDDEMTNKDDGETVAVRQIR